MYLMWTDKNKLKIKVLSHKRAVSSKKKKKKQPNNLSLPLKYGILQNEPEPKRYGLYSIKILTIKIPFMPVLV